MTSAFVPEGFRVPITLEGDGFHLEPLGPEHNERDYAAWTSSIDHIRATPGFADSNWPTPMSLGANLADLEQHARDFRERAGFTYSVLDGTDVIGCVYIYPAKREGCDAGVRSWVSSDRRDMDEPLWEAVSRWLDEYWPFTNPDYAPRR